MAMHTKMMQLFAEQGEERPEKPRTYGLTEIRGPSSAMIDGSALQDIFEMFGPFVDGLKFDGGSYSSMPKTFIKEITCIAHKHNVNVGTGDWADHLLQRGPSAFRQYVQECKDLGFDVIDLNVDSLMIPEENLLRLIRMIKSERLKVKPKFGIQFEAAAIPSKDRLFGSFVYPSKQKEMIEDVDLLIRKAERCLDVGADLIMIDADGVSTHSESLRTDAIAKIIGRLGLEKTMFEAGSPEMLEWFVGRYGSRVNLFVHHSHVGKLECIRDGAIGIIPSSLSQSHKHGPAIFF
ncbi:protein HEAT-STRESS-ASSOCIATED 32 [Cryptomeria japonica]|uniref:protein HEAT-STRESS-ASSOCIATED 32 n=1 Tax=Cryptomeria japonica TaxID=3369 RepID=UPI0027D9F622|nr:protein HEAT-STRESS-ASSOCIATED 32 [Cryptomeria japonica]